MAASAQGSPASIRLPPLHLVLDPRSTPAAGPRPQFSPLPTHQVWSAGPSARFSYSSSAQQVPSFAHVDPRGLAASAPPLTPTTPPPTGSRPADTNSARRNACMSIASLTSPTPESATTAPWPTSSSSSTPCSSFNAPPPQASYAGPSLSQHDPHRNSWVVREHHAQATPAFFQHQLPEDHVPRTSMSTEQTYVSASPTNLHLAIPSPTGISKPATGRALRRKRMRANGAPRELFQCPYCDKVSSENSNLKAHMRLHTGEKPYVCQQDACGKAFRWKSSLSYHQKAVHSNLRPYACTSCDKRFLESRKLQLHLDWCPAVRQDEERRAMEVANAAASHRSSMRPSGSAMALPILEHQSHMVAAPPMASISAPRPGPTYMPFQ